MDYIELRGDCANCAALCCVALAFDRSNLFAIDKVAGQPCPHLEACGTCSIHGEREERGFAGCVGFDCLGAGQRATKHASKQGHWQEDGASVAILYNSFGHLLRAHESLLLLDLAETLDISHIKKSALAELREALVDAGINGRDIAVARSRIDSYLRSLKPHISEVKNTNSV